MSTSPLHRAPAAQPQVLVVGGEAGSQPSSLPGWTTFVAGKALTLDLASEETAERLRYVTPAAERCPAGDNITFKSTSRSGDSLTFVTETEVLTLNRASLETTARVSHPWMNDVHHALALEGGGHLVMSTGLDLVLRLDPAGAVTARWYIGRGRLWNRFDRDTDYRRVRTTQPHHCHANHLAIVGRDLWVTRFHPEDALVIPNIMEHPGFDELPSPSVCHPIPGGPHDGIPIGDLVWFTTIDGTLRALDHGGSLARTIDLNEAARHGEPLGWCRGLLWIAEDQVLVGLSAYRHRRYGSPKDRLRARARLLIRKRSPVVPLPSEHSRIVHFDVGGATPRVIREYDVQEKGLRDIFSIVPLAD